jgi:hypothetical protein
MLRAQCQGRLQGRGPGLLRQPGCRGALPAPQPGRRPLDPAALNRDSNLLPKGLAWLLPPRVRRARHLIATSRLSWRHPANEPPGAPAGHARVPLHRARIKLCRSLHVGYFDTQGWGHLLRLQLIPTTALGQTVILGNNFQFGIHRRPYRLFHKRNAAYRPGRW